MKKQLLKITLVIGGATAFTTIGIFASDALQGITPSIGNVASISGACKEGSVEFKGPDGMLCVDIYEASPSKNCPNAVLRNNLHSEQNLNEKNCYAVSQPDVLPWNFISLTQAQRACSLAGKRLPTNEEWYRLALSTQYETCAVNDSSVQKTGIDGCVTANGVYDMVGNVWEWVDESVQGNSFDGRTLPETGYVSEVDADGIALTTSNESSELYGSDYFWSKQEGVFGMIRGGFYDAGKDAGLYATNASVPTSLSAPGVGFRCVEDII